jgi:hypothetical protein
MELYFHLTLIMINLPLGTSVMIYYIVNTSCMFIYTRYTFQVRLKIICLSLHCFTLIGELFFIFKLHHPQMLWACSTLFLLWKFFQLLNHRKSFLIRFNRILYILIVGFGNFQFTLFFINCWSWCHDSCDISFSIWCFDMITKRNELIGSYVVDW